MARIEYDIKFKDGSSIGAECAIEELSIGIRHMGDRVIDSVSVKVTGASARQDFQMVSDFFEVIKTHQRRSAIEPLPGHPGNPTRVPDPVSEQADMNHQLTKGPVMPMQMTKQELDQNPWPLWEQGKPVFPITLMHDDWARKLHDQTLYRLAERGGMSPREIYCNINMVRWPYVQQMDLALVMVNLNRNITDYYNRIK